MSQFNVNTNPTAQQNIYSLANNQSKLASIYSKLATGYNINSPADGPAAYSEITSLQTQIAGYDQASSNIQDASNAVNVASGALSTITDSLSQIRSLTVEANNSFNSPDDQAAIQGQINSLVSEVNSTASSTNFNGTPLLDGSLSNASVQSGPNVGDQQSISAPNSSANALGVNAIDVTQSGGAAAAEPIVDNAINSVLAAQAGLGASAIGLGFEADNDALASVNLQASQSNLGDLNIAAASTQATNDELKTEFSTALLAQANISQNAILGFVKS